MNCEQVMDLIGAYALGATLPGETALVAAHVEGCAECAAEVRALQEVVGLLPDAVEPVVPTPQMRERLMAAVGQTDGHLLRLPTQSPRGIPLASGPVSAPATAVAPARARFNVARYFPAAAAALLAISTLLGATTYNLWQNRPRTYPLHGFGEASQASGELVYLPGKHTAFLTLNHLGDPGANRVYELWLIRDGQPVAAGLLRPDSNGQASTTVGRDLSGFQVLALTDEPRGGSTQPSGQPLLTQKL